MTKIKRIIKGPWSADPMVARMYLSAHRLMAAGWLTTQQAYNIMGIIDPHRKAPRLRPARPPQREVS